MPPLESSTNNSNAMKFNSKITGVVFESDVETTDGGLKDKNISKYTTAGEWQMEYSIRNIILMSYFTIGCVYGGYLFVFSAKWATVFFTIVMYSAGVIGACAGAHRLWSHRSYKATWQLRVILIIFQAINFQDSAFHWARDHRVHHKYSDTDADPHNSTRGFFYSHIGWLLVKKHPEVIEKGNRVDLTDLYEDKVLMFQKKYITPLVLSCCFVLPTLIPMYFWDETLSNAWHVAFMFRYWTSCNAVFGINSFAHLYGMRPYDKNINPVQHIGVSLFCFGEGWHNYHHTFPWDYKASEWGDWSDYPLNISTAFIDLMAWIGWAYDLKSVKKDIVEKRVRRTGDGTHKLWGWGDKDIKAEDIQSTCVR